MHWTCGTAGQSCTTLQLDIKGKEDKGFFYTLESKDQAHTTSSTFFLRLITPDDGLTLGIPQGAAAVWVFCEKKSKFIWKN